MTVKGTSQRRKASKGQSLTEYGLILALIAVFCIGSLQILGQNITAKIYGLSNSIQ